MLKKFDKFSVDADLHAKVAALEKARRQRAPPPTASYAPAAAAVLTTWPPRSRDPISSIELLARTAVRLVNSKQKRYYSGHTRQLQQRAWPLSPFCGHGLKYKHRH